MRNYKNGLLNANEVSETQTRRLRRCNHELEDGPVNADDKANAK